MPDTQVAVLQGHEGAVLAVRFNTQGTYCLSCGKDRTIRLWNPHKGIPIKTYKGHGYEVRDVTVSRDNSKIASAGGDKQLFLWDVASGSVIRKFRGHDSTINSVAYGADEEVLVTGGYDQFVKIWDCRSKSTEPIQAVKAFKDSVSLVTVHAAEIIAAGIDGSVRRLDIRLGRIYTDQLPAAVTHAALSHDGLCILAACADSTMRLLDKAGGELLAAYQGHVHDGVKLECGFMPNDAHVIGCSEDGYVLYWDLVDAVCAKRFRAHTGVVCSLAVHPDGSTLLTSSVDGAIRVWK